MVNHIKEPTIRLLDILNSSDECSWLEAKGSRDIYLHDTKKEDFRSLLESVCSFSNEPNLGGGIILLGIRENDELQNSRYTVEGILNVDKAQKDIATQCKETFNIPIYPNIKVEAIGGKNIIRIEVHELPSTRKPLYFKKNGLPTGAYRRIGSTDLRCTDEDIGIFYENARLHSYDQTIVPGASVDEVDPAAVERYRQLRKNVNSVAEELTYNDRDLLDALGCISSEDPNTLNLAGVLLFGSYKLQRRTIPLLRVDYIRVPGNQWVPNANDTFRSIDMLGPLLLLVFRIVDAVNADLPKGFHLEEGEIQAQSGGLPVKVLREAIVNAMMHRSYREARPTQIVRYDNRIEIINAGYSLKKEDKYNRPGSEIRNRIIAPVFHDTNLAETKGSGIKRMCEEMKAAHLAVPTFESDRDGNTFTARLLLHHFLGEKDIEWLKNFSKFNLNEHQKVALIFLRETGAIDNVTYRQMNNCDTLQSSKDLRKMRDLGLLIAKGKGSATYYTGGSAIREIESTIESQINSDIRSSGKEQYELFSDQPNSYSDQVPPLSDQPNSHSDQVSTSTGQFTTMPDGIIELPNELKRRLSSLGERENNDNVIKSLIIDLCRVKPMKREEIARYLKRNESYIKNKFLKQMIKDGTLHYTYPNMLNHPNQAYTI